MSSSGYTALVTAAYRNHPALVASLLARPEADPNWVSEEGDSLLMTCCARGHSSVVRLLLARQDCDPNYAGGRDLTPLMLACMEVITCQHLFGIFLHMFTACLLIIVSEIQ